MVESLVIPAQPRTVSGTKGATELRRQGRIPGIVYGGEDPIPVSVTMHDIRHAIYTANFHKIKVEVDGKEILCILKDVQFHPVTDDVLHVDFLRLVEGQKVKVEIPVHFSGQSQGAKAGGRLMQKIRRVMIKAVPENLVDELILDVSDLVLGQSVRVRDIPPMEGVEILNPPGIPIATIEIPRVLKSLEAEAAKKAEEAAEAGEGEAGAAGAEGAEKAEEGGDQEEGSAE